MSNIKSLFLLFLSFWVPACLASSPHKPAKRKFYKHNQVRQCLQLDQERKESESRECWSTLLNRLQSDRSFRDASELSDADIAKIQQKVEQSTQRSSYLKRELDKCYKLPAPDRKMRIECFKEYLHRNKSRLSVSERFEVESSLKEMDQAGKRASGSIENTLEHAGRIMGMALHMEDKGVRIDGVRQDGFKQGSGQADEAGPDLEQGIIMAMDGVPSLDLDEAERISHLESCQDKPIRLTIRKGDSDDVRFLKLEVECGPKPKTTVISDFSMPSESCTNDNSSELDWGMSWCYHAADGTLEIEQVYKNSPADKAGVMPGHLYVRINEKSLLGMSPKQLSEIFSPRGPGRISFSSRQGALSSPTALCGPLLSEQQVSHFWNAILVARKKAKENRQK